MGSGIFARRGCRWGRELESNMGVRQHGDVRAGKRQRPCSVDDGGGESARAVIKNGLKSRRTSVSGSLTEVLKRFGKCHIFCNLKCCQAPDFPKFSMGLKAIKSFHRTAMAINNGRRRGPQSNDKQRWPSAAESHLNQNIISTSLTRRARRARRLEGWVCLRRRLDVI